MLEVGQAWPNPHFANLGDVWKHLLLTEVISCLRPEHYVETHAGSAIYRLVGDVERAIGAQAARERLGLRDEVRVIHGDGLAETSALLQAHAIGAASLVHVDPFDFRAAGPGVVSALELVTCLAAASIPTFAWYGLTAASAAHELFREVTVAVPAARAWCAELRVGGQRANATGIGSGCGVLFTATDSAQAGSMRRAADAYVRAFNEQSAAADAGVYVTASFVTSACDT